MTVGLLDSSILAKIDCDIDPLLSMTNNIIGGVILDLTILNDGYYSSRWRIYSCLRRNRVTLKYYHSCKIYKSTETSFSHYESCYLYPSVN